jgi:uncharacterized RDD family membrane protein YckC
MRRKPDYYPGSRTRDEGLPMSSNPNAAPTAVVRGVTTNHQLLAGRGTRLGAALIDNLSFVVAWFLGAAAGQVAGEALFGLSQTGMMVYLLLALMLFGVNLYLLHKDGQSIGKRLLRLKIVRRDGAGLGRVFSLRIPVLNIVDMVPVRGALFALVNLLFIFRDDRHCIHDLMADARVIAA